MEPTSSTDSFPGLPSELNPMANGVLPPTAPIPDWALFNDGSGGEPIPVWLEFPETLEEAMEDCKSSHRSLILFIITA